jgi:hypothetical protein
MIRNIRVFGLSLVAGLAMTAVVVSAAQATPTIESSEPGIVEGTASEKPMLWAAGGRTVECEAPLYNAFGGKQTELTVDPTDSPCTGTFAGKKGPATFVSNHCEYIYKNLATSGTSWTAQMDILCENPGEEMDISAYENEASHKAKKTLCTVQIPKQLNLGTVMFSNMTGSKPADVTINMTLSGIQLNISGPSFICGTSTNQGTYTGVYTLHAKNLGGELIPIWLSGS